jgi:hypothetical protein
MAYCKPPLPPHLQHRRVQCRYASTRYYQKRRAELQALGLTTRGTARKYTLHPELGHLHGQERKNARARFYRKLLNERGLSARRNPLKPRMSEQERAWREFRATMVLSVPQMLTPLER